RRPAGAGRLGTQLRRSRSKRRRRYWIVRAVSRRYHVRDMIYRCYMPSLPLSDFVELLWYSEQPAPSHGSERVLPTGTTELVVNLGDPRLDRFEAVVAGPHSRFFALDTTAPS